MISLIRPFFVAPPPERVVIIGAGAAGMAAAAALRERGVETTILERDARPGGRMATESFDGGLFDTGAQHFTARTPRFQRQVDEWNRRGLLREWSRGFPGVDGVFPNDRYARLRAVRGMATLARAMAEGLDIRCGVEVERLLWRGTHWEARTTTDQEHTAKAMILALPAPQALELLRRGNYEIPDTARAAVERLTFAPCLGLLATLDGPSGIPHPGGVRLHGEPLVWIGDNHRKGISPGAHALTIHAGPLFSERCWDSSDEVITRQLLAAAGEFIGAPVRATRVVRWRHARPLQTVQESHLTLSAEPPLVLAGDAFHGGGRVEAAILSGWAVGEALGSERKSLIADLLGL
ncbi:MAG: FAD-dependent oxidoreductase [Candidatus Sumerlaeia bacterium]|nr:FAD-dependent oxidoreductase [Candidatus Sumerlaeia bacterium]